MFGINNIIDLHLQKAVSAQSMLRTFVLAAITGYVTFLLPMILRADTPHFWVPFLVFSGIMIPYIVFLRLKYEEHSLDHIKFVSVDFASNILRYSKKYPPSDFDLRRAACIICDRFEFTEDLVYECLLNYYVPVSK